MSYYLISYLKILPGQSQPIQTTVSTPTIFVSNMVKTFLGAGGAMIKPQGIAIPATVPSTFELPAQYSCQFYSSHIGFSELTIESECVRVF
jgi:hypothetical protein